MRLELLEQDVFHTQYQRNNKAKAKKNLRCFPACRHAGHVEAGFCGRPVLVRVHYTVEDLASIGATGISAFGVFRSVNAESELALSGAFPRFGDMLSLEEVACRSLGPKRLEFEGGWFLGTLRESRVMNGPNGREVESVFAINDGKSNSPITCEILQHLKTIKEVTNIIRSGGS